MRVQILRNTVDISSTVLLDGFEIAPEFGGRTGQLRFSIVTDYDAAVPVVHWDEIEVYEITLLAGSAEEPLFGGVLFGEALFGGTTETQTIQGQKLFGGYVVNITVAPFSQRTTAAVTPKVRYDITVEDYMILLDGTLIPSVDYADTPDNQILTSLFSTYLPAVSTAGVSYVANVSLTLENVSLREVIERVADLTQAHMYLTPGKVFYYHSPTSEGAAISLSETPDNVTSFKFQTFDGARPTLQYREDFTTPVNRCTVIGQLYDNETAYSATYNDTASQAESWGIRAKTIVDRRVNSNAEALLRATAEVQQYANKRVDGTVVFWQDGVEVGKLLTIYGPSYGINGNYRVNRLTLRWERSRTVTTYTAQFGSFSPDLARTLRLLNRLAQDKANTPTAVPSNNSVTGEKIPALTITNSHIANATIQGSKIEDLTITGTKIANLTITNGKIGNLEITGAKIADGTITASKIGSLEITASQIANLTITSGKLASDSVTESKIANAAVTTGKIDNLAVTTGKIDNLAVTAGKIATGTITATQIAALTITANEIANLTITGGKIADATITSAKISDLAVDKISGWSGASITVTSALAFTGAGGIQVVGGGNVSISPGGLLATSADIKSAGVGWDINGGASPSLSGDSNSTVSATNGDFSVIDVVTYKRSGATGWSGQFTTADSPAKIVTVASGLITGAS